MSLARTALRIAACAALNADPVVAALCPGRVYDSRIDELDAKDPVPIIVVYTEDDRGRPYSVNNGGPPFDHECDLLIEISMRVLVQAEDDEDAHPVIGMAETDAETEATIDMLEERAVEAVTNADTPQARLIRQAVTRRCVELKSIRFATAESGSKLALRVVTLSTHLKGDQSDPRDVPAGVFGVLPEPLRTVAAAQAVGSSAYKICLAIAAKLNPNAPSFFDGVDASFQNVALDPDTAPDPANPLAPDPIEVSIDIPCPSTP